MPTHPFVSAGPAGLYLVHGESAGERFGSSVAFLKDWTGDGRDAVVIDSPLAALEDGNQSGGAFVYPFAPADDGFSSNPIAAFADETRRSGDRIGEWVTTHSAGDNHYIIVGCYDGNGFGRDDGSLCVFDFGVLGPAPAP